MNMTKEGAICAIIVAAGKGSRMGLGFNKLLAPICGLPVLHWTIKAFAGSGLVDKLILVINTDDEAAVSEIASHFQIGVTLVRGGAERQQSVYNGLKIVPDICDTVLIHDGARPFVDAGIINRSIENARLYGAACAGMPVKDTIKCLDSEGCIVSTPGRETLWAAQTPQAFKRDIILKAHENAFIQGLKATDDAMLAESIGIKVRMFEGSHRNIKITSKEDLILAEALAAIGDGR